MAFLDYFKRQKADNPQSAVTLNSPGWLSSWGGSGIPLFGDSISDESAMAVASVFRCVNLLSGTVASVDCGIYEDDGDKGQVRIKNKLSSLLTNTPYPGRQLTSFMFKEMLMIDLLLRGDAYAVIRYDQSARIAALEYVHPHFVQVSRVNQRNQYKITWNDGRPVENVDFESMVHIPGPGFDGFHGMSRIRANARNSISMARSIEETLGKSYDNAMAPKTVIKLPPGMSPDALKRLREHMANEFSGKSNAGKTLYLDAGSEVDSLSINVTDLALLDAMKANTVQIAMFFGIPPILLGIDQVTSFGSGISSLLIAFLRFGLNSDLERIEAELTARLCSGNQYVLFDRDQLLQMDASGAADVYAKEVASGVSTINEIRRRQHKPVVEGGDVPLTNSTNISLAQAIQPRATANQPAPEPGQAP